MYDIEQKPGEFTPELTLSGAVETGSLVVISDGEVIAAADSVGDGGVVLGLAQSDAEIGEVVICRRGVFALHLDPDSGQEAGVKVYAVDNETVTDDPGATPVKAGILLGLDAEGKALVDVTHAALL